MTQARDYYEVMGLKRDANEKDIKMAYRRLARKYHPDINKEPNAEEKFKELGHAYEVLKDPQKRAQYDQFGHQEAQGHPHEPHKPYYTYTQQGRGSQWGGAGAEIDEDFLASIFGHARPKQRAMAGEDYQANITLNLEDGFKGCTRKIEIPVYTQDAQGQMQMKTQTLNVKIPAGVRQGQKIRLPGQGGPGFNKGPAGDLYLTVHFHKHPFFELKEKDIWLTLPVTPWEGALGATLKVPTLGGVVDLKIPPNSQAGQKLRLKGRGFPGKTPGDQMVILKIVIPKPENEKAKELYEQMAQTMPFNPRAAMGV